MPIPDTLMFYSGSCRDLRALFDFVRVSLAPAEGDSWKGPVLLVDDLSVLLSLGAAPVAVLDFIHYCRVSVCCQLKVLLPWLCSEPPGQTLPLFSLSISSG